MITTNYITETEFRNCESNNLSNPPPFTYIKDKDKPVKLNTNYDKSSSIFKVLAIDDTFHDFSKDRNGYNASKFNADGPANYLLTGKFFTGDNISTYKNTLNYDEYKTAIGKFETKVATSIDIVKGLQPAEITITYDDIIEGITIDRQEITIGNNLKEKIKLSNGSIQLCLNMNNHLLKNLDQTKVNFSDYIFYVTKGDNKKIEEAKLKISAFIRWYLHSDDFEDKLPSESMKILSDAGISFLGDFFSVEGSMVTPFVAIPCFLDSASTSVSLLDPTIDIAFETISDDYIIPIVSNYFSCDKYFMCYLLNPKSTFDKDNLYNFSVIFLNIDNIPELYKTVKDDITVVVRKTASILDKEYIQACTNIKNFIDAYPGLVARYYFGEVKKNAQDNDDSSCGTCGAGVPYLGKVLDTLIKARNNIKPDGINGVWSSTNINNIKDSFNNLKKLGSLNSRIPIADARILKLFCSSDTKDNTFCSIQQDNLDSLFQILADYKRTGDYQQSYTVLKQILREGTNTGCYTFCSGDELSTLVGRLLGVPSIYQIANGSTCSLYRCNLFKANPKERVRLKITNDIGIIRNYIDKIIYKFQLTYDFVNDYYINICTLRQQLSDFLQNISPSDETIFIALKYYNAIEVLSEILEKCINLTTNTDENYINQFLSKLYAILIQYKDINEIINNSSNKLSLDQFSKNISECLVDIAKIEDGKMFDVFIYIQENFPLVFINSELKSDFFDPLTDKDNTKTPTFKRPALGLNVKMGKDNNKDSKSLIDNLNKLTSSKKPNERAQRHVDVKQKEIEILSDMFVNNYNKFITSFKSSIISEYTIGSYSDFNSTYLEKRINQLTTKIDDVISEQKEKCNETETTSDNIKNILIKFIKKFKEMNLPQILPQTGGGNETGINHLLNQTGGLISSKQDYNRFCIFYEIQKIVLNITNKCAIYMSNVSKQYFVKNNNNIQLLELLNNISNDYETNDFCSQLLFEQNDDVSLDDDNNGFVIALKLLAEKYTYSDIMLNSTSNDGLLTVNDMLNALNLPYIKLMILLLSWNKEENIQLGCSLIDCDLSEINISKNYGSYSTIYNYLTVNNSTILSIYSIMCFSLINYYYYGEKSICFSKTDCKNFASELFKTYGSNQGYIYSNNTPQVFLQRDLESISNTIFSVASNKIGLTNTATGPASNTRYKRTIGTIGVSNNQGTQKKMKISRGNKTKKQKKTTNGGRNNNNYTKSNKIQTSKSKERETRRRY
uniref:Uncharacterized protein n=1 Tax=viral metagenome TaxID=1070528 RepID=A0A6C0ID23_9ZZZZ